MFLLLVFRFLGSFDGWSGCVSPAVAKNGHSLNCGWILKPNYAVIVSSFLIVKIAASRQCFASSNNLSTMWWHLTVRNVRGC